ncbi:MAG: glycosyltransferase family 39 protein, partial [Methanosarcina sp.]|nr:glycosyltransferase family 39 protein [Methanosarcina sp.]
SEFILRFIPALLGIFTIPLFFFIGKELVDERVGILSATLLTFSLFHIYYSQEAYSYSLVLFIFSLLLYCYLRALRTRERKFWVMFGFFSGLAFWVHFYTLIPVFFIFLHALIVFLPERAKGIEAFKNLFYSCLTFFILILPLIPIVVQRYLTLTAKPPTYGILGPALISETFIRFSTFSPAVTIVFLLLFGAGTIFLYRLKKQLSLLWIILIFLPLLLSVALSSKMTMNPRYLIFLLAIFYPGIACSYAWIRQYSPSQWIVLFFIAGFILCSTPPLFSYYQGYSKENWRGLASLVQETTKPGDVIVLVPAYLEMPFNYYYNNVSDGTRVLGAASVAELENITRTTGDHETFFIVTPDITAANPQGLSLIHISE